MTQVPDVSVILPLTDDDRSHGREALESWMSAQTLPRERFEVVVVSAGAKAEVEAHAEGLLGPGDRLIRGLDVPDRGPYDVGARAARGRLLLFTEPHCVGAPTCLEEVVGFFAQNRYDGACCDSVGISPNAFARAEARQFQRFFRDWVAPGNWRKVFVRGFALRRERYLESDGFEESYGHFSEQAFAASLHAQGQRLGYAKGAVIGHVNSTSVAELESTIEDFTREEWGYLADHPREHCERYFGIPPEWSESRWLEARSARSACSAAVRNLMRRSVWRSHGGAKAMLQTLGRLAPRALFGSHAALLAARLSCAAVRARCRLWRFDEERLDRAYAELWQRVVHRTRLRLLAQRTAKAPLPVGQSFPIDALPEDRLFGFHPIERADGRAFRWSRSVAFADLPLAPGSYRVEIDTAGLRNPGFPPLCLWVFFNGRRVPATALRFEQDTVSFEIDRSLFKLRSEQRLTVTCAPLRQQELSDSPDDRELGLPVASIDFTPVDSGAP